MLLLIELKLYKSGNCIFSATDKSIYIPGMVQKLGDGKKAPQIFCLERAVVLNSTPQVKTENLRQSRHCQNQFLNHERYTQMNSKFTNLAKPAPQLWDNEMLLKAAWA